MWNSMNSEDRSDVRHSLYSVISTGTNAAFSLFSGIILAKGMSQHEYGLASSAFAISLVAQEFVGRGINDSIIRLGTLNAAGSLENAKKIFQGGLLIKLGITLMAGVIFVFFRKALSSALGCPELENGFPAIFMIVAGYGLWTFFITVKQAEYRFMDMALFQPASNLLKTMLLLIFMIYGILGWLNSLWLTAASLFFSVALLGGRTILGILKEKSRALEIATVTQKVLGLSIWGVIGGVTYVGFSRMDVILLTKLTKTSEVAVYNLAWQILTVMDLLAVSIGAVMIPKITHFTSRSDLIMASARCLKLSVLASLFALPLLFLGKFIPDLFGPAYGASSRLLSIMFGGNLAICLTFPLIGILYATNRFRYLAVVQALLLAASIPAYTFAIKLSGTVGAAWMTLILKGGMGVLIACGAAWSIIKAPVAAREK